MHVWEHCAAESVKMTLSTHLVYRISMICTVNLTNIFSLPFWNKSKQTNVTLSGSREVLGITLTRLWGLWLLWKRLCGSLWGFRCYLTLKRMKGRGRNFNDARGDTNEIIYFGEQKCNVGKYSLSIFVPLNAQSCISLIPLLYSFLESVTRL